MTTWCHLPLHPSFAQAWDVICSEFLCVHSEPDTYVPRYSFSPKWRRMNSPKQQTRGDIELWWDHLLKPLKHWLAQRKNSKYVIVMATTIIIGAYCFSGIIFHRKINIQLIQRGKGQPWSTIWFYDPEAPTDISFLLVQNTRNSFDLSQIMCFVSLYQSHIRSYSFLLWAVQKNKIKLF